MGGYLQAIDNVNLRYISASGDEWQQIFCDHLPIRNILEARAEEKLYSVKHKFFVKTFCELLLNLESSQTWWSHASFEAALGYSLLFFTVSVYVSWMDAHQCSATLFQTWGHVNFI